MGDGFYTLLFCFPSTLFILNSEFLVKFWLQDNLAQSVSDIGSILIIGISVNSLAQLNFSLLQLAGREKLGAYLQIYGLVVLLVLASILGIAYGVIGVACAFFYSLGYGCNSFSVLGEH